MVDCAAARLLLSTCRLVTVPPRPAFTPAHRCSSPMLPASWTMQMTFFDPADFSWVPTALPATVSSEPTCVRAPNDFDCAAPELMVMTGMPACTACWIEDFNASGLAIETTSPSTFSLTAASISCACLVGSPSLWYSMVSPMSLPACSAPFFTMLQKASPLDPCVTTAILKPYLPAPPPAWFCAGGLLTALLLVQADRTSTAAS